MHPGVRRVLAPNPGPMTLEGTNTWVLHAPRAAGAVVVDPGPDDAGHRAAVLAAAAAAGARVALVVLTHSHPDHSAGAAELCRRTGAPVRAATGPGPLRADPLREGDVLTGGALGDLGLQVLATPGHTADSLSLLLPAAPGGPAGLLTGDTVLGRGSTVVAAPDGSLGAHLASLRRLAALTRDLAARGRGAVLLPGHGPVRADAAAAVADLLAHREQRLAQVRAAVTAGAGTPGEVVDAVYPGLAAPLRPAAEATAAAALALLRAGGGPLIGGRDALRRVRATPVRQTAAVDERVVRRAPLFQGVDDEAAAPLLAMVTEITLRRGDVLFSQGDAPSQLFVVDTGKIKLGRTAPDGRENLMAVLGPGEMFGELSWFDPGPRTSAAVAVSPSRLAALDYDDLYAWMAGRPEVAQQLLRALARRLRRTNAAMADLVFTDVPGRVAGTLLDLAQRFGKPVEHGLRVPHDLTQEELAQLVGASRETVNKALADFAARGWLRLEARSVVLLELDRLRRRAH